MNRYRVRIGLLLALICFGLGAVLGLRVALASSAGAIASPAADRVAAPRPPTVAVFDGAVTAIFQPASACTLTTSTTVRLGVANAGTEPIDAITITLTADGPITSTLIETQTVVLPPLAATVITLTQPLDLSAGGVYTVVARLLLPGDDNPANDRITRTVVHAGPALPLPLLETFDAFPLRSADPNPLPFAWENAADPGEHDWWTHAGETPTLGTGPTADHTTGTPDGRYLYVEDSAPYEAPATQLMSPCFDLSVAEQPVANFWLHSHDLFGGTQANTVTVDLIDPFGDVAAFDVITPVRHLPDGWHRFTVDLSPHAAFGSARLRFSATTDNGSFGHDIALDDFAVYDNARPILDGSTKMVADAAVRQGGATTYTLTLINDGGVVAAGLWLTDTLPPASQIVSGSLQFTPGLTPPPQAVHADGPLVWAGGTLSPGVAITIAYAARLTGTAGLPVTNTAVLTAPDAAPVTMTASVNILPPRLPAPLACNAGQVAFNAGVPADWTVRNDAPGNPVVWSDLVHEPCGELGNWASGSGNAACASSRAQDAASYDTALLSNRFVLPPFDAATLSYLANYANFAGGDFLDLDISADDGTTWDTLLSWNEDHHPAGFRTAPGEQVSVDLTAYAGLTVTLRWRYYDPVGGNPDWYAQIDSVSLSCTPRPRGLAFEPAGLDLPHAPTVPQTQTVTLTNSGWYSVSWSLALSNTLASDGDASRRAGCADPTDLPWLVAPVVSGTLAAETGIPLQFGAHPDGQPYGQTDAVQLCFSTTDDATPFLTLPLTRTVANVSTFDGYPLAWHVPGGATLGPELGLSDGLTRTLTPFWVPGITASVNVTVTGPGIVAAWADWDADYRFAASEGLFAVDLVTGTHNITFTIPYTYVPGAPIHLRARLYPASVEPPHLSPIGRAQGGEVEDHLITFVPVAIRLQSLTADTADGFGGAAAVMLAAGLTAGAVALTGTRRRRGRYGVK